jgi:iron complex outermembrane receptor protein
MFRTGFLVVVLVFVLQHVHADISDTIIALEPVVAKGVKFEHVSAGAKLVPIDSFQLTMNQMSSVAELFMKQSLVSVTSYGPGGQAGIKIRGGSADHTTIVWNGINLKPPMSGEINYSAINSGVFDQIEIQPGGSSTMYGSGAATGVVFLSNKLDMNRKGILAGINVEAGSFGSCGLSGDIGFVSEKIGTRLFISGQMVENNFTYKVGNEIKTLEHGAYQNISLLQQNVIRISPSTKLETDIWFTNLFKEIPSMKSASGIGKTEQEDQNFNFALNLSQYLPLGYFKYRSGVILYNNEFLGYSSDYYTAVNRSNSFIHELETKININSENKVFLGVNYTLDKAFSDSYTKDATRNQLDFFGRYSGRFFSDNLSVNVEGREAITDGQALPFVYSGGLNLHIIESLNWKVSASKLYSLPDLNDLYWGRTGFASGNPDLKPENGWNIETGFIHNFKADKVNLSHEATVYRNYLNQAIVWLPDETGIWSPLNVDGTLTTGLEFAGRTGIKFSISEFVLSYDYVFTNAKVLDGNKLLNELQQKRYVPKHKAGFNAQYTVNEFAIATFAQFVGERLIDDVSLPLDPYVLVDFYFSYNFKIRKTSIFFYLKLKNILDTDYEVMKDYAQPGRSINVGTNFKF